MTSVRRANTSDAPAVTGLVQRAYAPYVERIGRRPAPMEEDFHHTLAAQDSWVIEADDELVGVVTARRCEGYLLIETLAVAPQRQGQGAGASLLRTAEKFAAEAGFTRVRLYTNVAMTENLCWYPRQGYQETGRREQDGYQRVFYVKDVTG